jgi:hypothetical protein
MFGIKRHKRVQAPAELKQLLHITISATQYALL